MPIAQRFKATTSSMPSPIGGWNARDSLAAMQPTDAVQMVNWYPTPSDIMVRKGYTKYSTGITGQVNTLMTYAGTTSQTLFAAANNSIWDASNSTAVLKQTGFANDKFQFVNFSNDVLNFFIGIFQRFFFQKNLHPELKDASCIHPLQLICQQVVNQNY